MGGPRSGSHEKKAIIQLCTTVKDIQLDGTITLEDGTVIKKDLVVVADGIRVSKLTLGLDIAS